MIAELPIESVTLAVRFLPAGKRGVERAAQALAVHYSDVTLYHSFLETLQLGQWARVDVELDDARALVERFHARGIEARLIVLYDTDDPTDSGYTEVAL